MRARSLIVVLLPIVLFACGGDEKSDKPAPKKEGRAETQSIRNTEAVGINGKAIADKVDDALNKSEQKKEAADRAAEEQTQ